jgi:hypothetical protein
MNNFPLNVMYWVKNIDDTYELLDGQQRTISICEYVTNKFSVVYRTDPNSPLTFENLKESQKSEAERILNYKLMIYFCEGTDKEKLDWFKIINTVGQKLTLQEMRNAIYTGEWLSEVKKRFSKTGCPAYGLAEEYMKGVPIRQDYLETALRWISSRNNLKEIENYMSDHQHDLNASEIWLYFQAIISWVKETFPEYRKDMKGLEWGILYNKYKDNKYDSNGLEREIKKLIDDDEVTNKRGIYEFLLGGETDQKILNLREFENKITTKVFERQKGVCPMCGSEKHYEFKDMEADHIIPWSKGGKTEERNCQMLCMHHNRTKSGK